MEEALRVALPFCAKGVPLVIRVRRSDSRFLLTPNPKGGKAYESRAERTEDVCVRPLVRVQGADETVVERNDRAQRDDNADGVDGHDLVSVVAEHGRDVRSLLSRSVEDKDDEAGKSVWKDRV